MSSTTQYYGVHALNKNIDKPARVQRAATRWALAPRYMCTKINYRKWDLLPEMKEGNGRHD